jgi:hypothetical protein
VKLILKGVVPHVVLSKGFAGLVPITPELIVHPVAGVITQFRAELLLQTPALFTVAPEIEVFVKVTTVFTQTIVSGAIAILATGSLLVVIGSMVEVENPQGFTALIRIKKVFEDNPPVAPQEELKNVST